MIMSGALHEPKSELRANLLELAEACCYDRSNPEDCPLFLLRQKEPARRFDWVNALGESDLQFLAAYHHVCLTTKIAAGPAQPSS